MSRASERYPTSAFDYALPADRIAQHPHQRRDESRLLVLHRSDGRIEHRIFRDLLDLIPAGDAVVLNETRVFPARLIGRKPTGAVAEVLLLRPLGPDASTDASGQASPAGGGQRPDRGAPSGDGVDRPPPGSGAPGVLWEAIVRPGGKLKPGRVVEVSDELSIEIVDSTPDGGRIVRLVTPLTIDVALERYGRIPLPPYVEREPGPEDRERYQTVFAREAGSVAAPTAGLHFTETLLQGLEAKGVRLVRVVLHVGIGTFRPVEVEDPERHRMHSERYSVSAEAAEAINGTRAAGGRIWAVGTTVARTLETVADEEGVVHPGVGSTALFIRPPYRFRAVDRLVTNFHLPRSTLLMLVAAFGGYENVMRAYRVAVEEGYRFYSYGDAMVLI